MQMAMPNQSHLIVTNSGGVGGDDNHDDQQLELKYKKQKRRSRNREKKSVGFRVQSCSLRLVGSFQETEVAVASQQHCRI